MTSEVKAEGVRFIGAKKWGGEEETPERKAFQ